MLSRIPGRKPTLDVMHPRNPPPGHGIKPGSRITDGTRIPQQLLERVANYPLGIFRGVHCGIFDTVKWSPSHAGGEPSDVGIAAVAYLASDAGQADWPSIPGTGVFSADENLSPRSERGAVIYTNPVTRGIASILTSGSTLCFDASDLMPASLSAAFNQAVLEFLGDPSRYLYPPGGVDPLLRQLDQLRRQAYHGQPTTYTCG